MFEDIITANDRSVIATGGGIVLRAINRNFLREYGQCVYLSASKEQLYERTLRDKSRPLLQVENRQQVISDLLKERDPLYREVADLVFTADGGQINKVAKRLLDALSEL